MFSSQQLVGGFNPFGRYWLLVKLYHLPRDRAFNQPTFYHSSVWATSTIYMDAYTNHFPPPNNSHLSI